VHYNYTAHVLGGIPVYLESSPPYSFYRNAYKQLFYMNNKIIIGQDKRWHGYCGNGYV
jgi:hypothetical protein